MSEERVEYRAPGERQVARVKITLETAVPLERIKAALAEVAREGAVRRAVYPRLIGVGKLRDEEAQLRIARLQDAWRVLNAVVVGSGVAPSGVAGYYDVADDEPEPELEILQGKMAGGAK